MSIAANSRWNLFGFGCTLAAHIITVPIVIHHIGIADFGRAGLVIAVWVPLFIGTVLSSAVVRLVSSGSEGSAQGTVIQTLNNALLICSAVCAALGVLVAVAMPWVFSHYVSDPRPTGAWRIDFMVAAIGWAAQQFSLVLQGVIVGEREFRTVALVNFASAVANVCAILIVVRTIPGTTGYLTGLAVGFCISAVIWAVVVRVRHGHGALRITYHRESMRPLAIFGKWQAVALVAGNFGNQIDRYVLGVIAPARVMGQFNAAFRLQEAVYALVMKGSEVLFPHFGANALKSSQIQLDFLLRASWITATFGTAVLVPAIALAQPLLLLWVGPTVADGGAFLLKTLVLGGVIGCASNVTTYFFLGMGQAQRVAGLSIWYSVITVVSSLIVLYAFGPYAAGVGIVIASVVRLVMSMALAKKDFGAALSTGRLFASTALPIIVGLALAAALEMTPIADVRQWYSVIGAYLATGFLVALIGAACVSVSVHGRAWPAAVIASIWPAARPTEGS